MKLINIGFGNMVSASRLIALVSPESAPIKDIPVDLIPPQQVLDPREEPFLPAWFCEIFVCAQPKGMELILQRVP